MPAPGARHPGRRSRCTVTQRHCATERRRAVRIRRPRAGNPFPVPGRTRPSAGRAAGSAGRVCSTPRSPWAFLGRSATALPVPPRAPRAVLRGGVDAPSTPARFFPPARSDYGAQPVRDGVLAQGMGCCGVFAPAAKRHTFRYFHQVPSNYRRVRPSANSAQLARGRDQGANPHFCAAH